MTPATISITGTGRLSVGKDVEAVLRKIEYWHQTPVTKFRIMTRQGQGTWHGVRWDGKAATTFVLNETDENKAMQALLLSIRSKRPKALRPRNRCKPEACYERSRQNLFIEQHKDGYSILRGGVKEPLGIEPTQDCGNREGQKTAPRCRHSCGARFGMSKAARDKWRRV
jgi:hypothetical protein